MEEPRPRGEIPRAPRFIATGDPLTEGKNSQIYLFVQVPFGAAADSGPVLT